MADNAAEPGGWEMAPGVVAVDVAVKVMPLSPKASEMDGSDLRPVGDSFSSLVDRRLADSAGDM